MDFILKGILFQTSHENVPPVLICAIATLDHCSNGKIPQKNLYQRIWNERPFRLPGG